MAKIEYDKDVCLTLDSGDEVLVTYFVDDYGSEPSGQFGPPENYDPGSSALICVGPVFAGDDEIEISDEQREKFETEIVENPDWWMPSEPDYDYYD